MGNKAVAKLAMFQCVHNEYKKTREDEWPAFPVLNENSKGNKA